MNHPSWRRLLAIPATLIVVLGIALGPNASQVEANHDLDWAWKNTNDINVCVVGAFNDQQENDIHQGINKWLDVGHLSRPDWHFTTSPCYFEDVIVELAYIGPAAQADCDTVSGDLRTWNGRTVDECVHATIQFNQDTYGSYYWGEGTQNCYVLSYGSGCKPDAKTMVAHEFGHVLGLGHVWDPGEAKYIGGEDCDSGGYSTSYDTRCEGRARRMMANYAGFEFINQNNRPASMQTWGWDQIWQGYRHSEIRTGDITRMEQIYPTTKI
jgi:hypothetical protein